MELSDEAIGDFIEAWRKEFGETLAVDTARLEASRLLDFFNGLSEMSQ